MKVSVVNRRREGTVKKVYGGSMAFDVIEVVGGLDRCMGYIAVISRIMYFRGRNYHMPVAVFTLFRYDPVGEMG